MTSGEITSENTYSFSNNSISIVADKNLESKSSDNIYHCLLNDFYGFDHNNTKWLLASLSSNIGLKRLQLSKDSKLKMLRSYYEIRDNPKLYNVMNKEHLLLNKPAFHPLASLYLNPLGICVYIRNEVALRIIVNMKCNSFSDPCFVQKWWSKGENKYLTDFSTINLLSLAIRRNFMEGISIMMSEEFDPKEPVYHIDHIQSTNSSKTHVYQDGLDLAFSLLYDRPGLDIGTYFKTIVNKKMKNYFDIIVFEMNTIFQHQNSNTVEKVRLCSLFRSVLKRAVQSHNYKYSSKFLSVLEIIQNKGFFRYLNGELKYFKNEKALLLKNHKQFCEEAFYPGDEMESQKIYKSDISKLPSVQRSGCLLLDRTICLELLLLWLLEMKKRERVHLKTKIARLFVNILIDSNLIIWFLQSPDKVVSNAMSTTCCKVGPVSDSDILSCKSIMVEVVQHSNLLKTKLYHKITKVSTHFHPLNLNLQISKKKHSNKKTGPKPDYMVCDSHTIQSWNHPKNVGDLQLLKHYKSEDIPILSLKYKFVRSRSPLTTNILNKSVEFERINQFHSLDKTTYSVTNAHDSVHEVISSQLESTLRYSPPPLVVSKHKSAIVNSAKAIKKDFSSGDNVDQTSQTSRDNEESTLIENMTTDQQMSSVKYF